MNTFDYFQPVSLAIFLPFTAFLAFVLAWWFSRKHPRPWVFRASIFVAVMFVAFGLGLFDRAGCAAKNRTALAWLKGEGVQTGIAAGRGVSDGIELTVVDSNIIVIGGRKVADPAPHTQAVTLKRGEIPAFNAYVAAHFPALAASGRRVNDPLVLNP